MRMLLAAAFAALLSLTNGPALAQLQGLGVVLLHGKQAAPASMSGLAGELRSQGAIVVTPEMPWSSSRMYDTGWIGAMHEIGAALRQAKAQGATRFVVGGHSMGASAAMAFAHLYPGLAGIVALAPGHVPEGQVFQSATASSVAKAKDMVAAGQGDEVASFTDVNGTAQFGVRAKAKDYLELFDPDGPANFHKSFRSVGSHPLFVAAGSSDRLMSDDVGGYNKTAKNKKSKLVVVPADHTGVPRAATPEVVEWLKTL